MKKKLKIEGFIGDTIPYVKKMDNIPYRIPASPIGGSADGEVWDGEIPYERGRATIYFTMLGVYAYLEPKEKELQVLMQIKIEDAKPHLVRGEVVEEADIQENRIYMYKMDDYHQETKRHNYLMEVYVEEQVVAFANEMQSYYRFSNSRNHIEREVETSVSYDIVTEDEEQYITNIEKKIKIEGFLENEIPYVKKMDDTFWTSYTITSQSIDGTFRNTKKKPSITMKNEHPYEKGGATVYLTVSGSIYAEMRPRKRVYPSPSKQKQHIWKRLIQRWLPKKESLTLIEDYYEHYVVFGEAVDASKKNSEYVYMHKMDSFQTPNQKEHHGMHIKFNEKVVNASLYIQEHVDASCEIRKENDAYFVIAKQ